MRRRREIGSVSRLGLELGLINTPGPSLSTFLSPVMISPVVVRSLEDRRTFHPAGRLRPPASFLVNDARFVSPQSWSNERTRNDPYPSSTIGFAVPARVAVCVRRKQRREALFGVGAVGSGKRVSKFRRRSEWSNIKC